MSPHDEPELGILGSQTGVMGIWASNGRLRAWMTTGVRIRQPSAQAALAATFEARGYHLLVATTRSESERDH